MHNANIIPWRSNHIQYYDMAVVIAMMVPLPKTKTKIPAVILPVEKN